MAGRLNKAVSTISGYESDAHTISLDVFISVASFFGVSLDELAGIEKPEQVTKFRLSKKQQDVILALRGEY